MRANHKTASRNASRQRRMHGLAALAPMLGLALGLAAMPALAQQNTARERVLAPAAALLPVALQNVTLVQDRELRLGHLFAGVSEDRNSIVDHSPLPGDRRIYTASHLHALAQRHGLDWRPNSPLDKVVIERASVIVPVEEIELEIRDALASQGRFDEIDVDLFNRGVRLHIATDRPMDLRVEQLNYDNRSQRFQATVTAPANDPEAQSVQVTGRVYTLVDVPVLARAVLPGAVIQQSDIAWKKVRQVSLAGNVMAQPDEIVGAVTRRPLAPNRPLLRTDVKPNLLTTRGDRVTIVATTANMRLTATGIAMQNGAEGDLIQVTNTATKKIVQGRIIGPNLVEVVTRGQVALN
ncbi:MAG: flagellar basal body P-ring formation chaperone FlgA [Oceanibaculum sp.]